MEKQIDELMKNTTEILYGIFSEQITEKEYKLIKLILLKYFDNVSNDGDSFTALSIFNTYLQYLLSLLMDGYVEED